MNIAHSIAEVRDQVATWHKNGLRVALVPTMGALHRGHLELVEEVRRRADRVVVSIFVNPTQFGPGEDLDRYPRDLDGDRSKLETVGADCIFHPTPAMIYPPGFQTRVELDLLPKHLCGLTRSHHFGGVAVVVLKLFNIVKPDIAIFGEKDFQQVRVIERMVLDLDLELKIVRHPTVREPDGLAMSSRNAYLTSRERAIAVAVPNTIAMMARRIANGFTDAVEIARDGRSALMAEGLDVEYVEVLNPETLDSVNFIDGPVRIAVAVRIGKTRLIDNLAAFPPQ